MLLWSMSFAGAGLFGAMDCSGAPTRTNGHPVAGTKMPTDYSADSASTEESSRSAISALREASTSFTTTTGLTTWDWLVTNPSAGDFARIMRAIGTRADGTAFPGSASGQYW